jgi:hypothetical protein
MCRFLSVIFREEGGVVAFLYYAIRQNEGKLMVSTGKKASNPPH